MSQVSYIQLGVRKIRSVNPTFCFKLENGATYLALVRMGIRFLMAIILVILIISAAVQQRMVGKGVTNNEGDADTVLKLARFITYKGSQNDQYFYLMVLIFCTMSMFLNYYLYKGIQKKNLRMLNNWWNITGIITLFIIFWEIVTFIGDVEGNRTLEFGETFEVAIDLYSLWVISKLIYDIAFDKTISTYSAGTGGTDSTEQIWMGTSNNDVD